MRQCRFEIEHALQIAVVAKEFRDFFPTKHWIKQSDHHVMFMAYTRSKIIACPCPTPMHMVHRAYFSRVRDS